MSSSGKKEEEESRERVSKRIMRSPHDWNPYVLTGLLLINDANKVNSSGYI